MDRKEFGLNLSMEKMKIISKYEGHLRIAMDWLEQSVLNGKGGSSAHYTPLWGWSKPYPETTGYLIPTLLDYGKLTGDEKWIAYAEDLGRWLIEIQLDNGSWQGGLYPNKNTTPSVFNTGQILLGLTSLFKVNKDEFWLKSAVKGAKWLASGVSSAGFWKQGHYMDFNPSYYTRVAWPMLEVWKLMGDKQIHTASCLVLDAISKKKMSNHAFKDWEFQQGKPAFTHTIAYTIRGFIEAGILLEEWEKYSSITKDTLDLLYKKTQLNRGRLAGAYDENWEPTDWYSCLTGNVQIAICFLRWHEQDADLRLVDASCKLLDHVCLYQKNSKIIKGLNGGVAGSRPVWGKYMMFRYPNWSTKFLADALMITIKILREVKK